DRAPFWVKLGIEGEGLALFQHHATFLEALDANLRATEVEQDADTPVRNARRLTHHGEAPAAVLDGSVRSIEPHAVDTVAHHSRKLVQIMGRRPYGGANLSASQPNPRRSCTPRGYIPRVRDLLARQPPEAACPPRIRGMLRLRWRCTKCLP